MAATTLRLTPHRSTTMADLEMAPAWDFTQSMAAWGRMATRMRSHVPRFSSVSGASMAPHMRAMVMVSALRSVP